MPRKNQLTKFQTITNGDMSDFVESSVTSIEFLDNIGYQFNFTGSPVGTFEIQISADYAQDSMGNVTNAGNWVNVAVTYWNGTSFVTVTDIPTSVGSPIFLDLALLSAPWIKTNYGSISGTGTLNAFITGKSVSG